MARSSPKPSRNLSRAPGRKFSITTSVRATSRSRISRARASCRSSVRLRLFRFTVACMNETGAVGPGSIGGTRRASSPLGCSTLMTSAPRSASTQPAIGPAQVVVSSTTRTSASGPARSWRASR